MSHKQQIQIQNKRNNQVQQQQNLIKQFREDQQEFHKKLETRSGLYRQSSQEYENSNSQNTINIGGNNQANYLLRKRKRHKSLTDLNQDYNQKSQDQSSDTSSNEDEDNNSDKKGKDYTDGLYSDKDNMFFKRENIMKMKQNISDYEEDLIREIENEYQGNQSGVKTIEEEDDSDNDNEENDSDNNYDMPLFKDENKKKDINNKNISIINHHKQSNQLQYKELQFEKAVQAEGEEGEEEDEDDKFINSSSPRKSSNTESESNSANRVRYRKQSNEQLKQTGLYLQQQQEKRKDEIQRRKQKKFQLKQQKKEQEKLEKKLKSTSKKKKQFHWKIYKRLLNYSIKEWKISLLAFISMLIMSVTQIFVPRMCGNLLDATIKHQSLDLLNTFAVQSLVIFVLHAVFDVLRTFFYNILGEKIISQLTNDCFKNFMQAEIEFHDKYQSGELISRIMSDISTAKAAASGNVGTLFRNTIVSIGYVSVLVYTSWKLSLVIMICIPIFMISGNYFGKFTKKLVRKYQKVMAKLTSHAAECFINIRTVKSFSNETYEINRFAKKQRKGYKLGYKKAVSLALHNGMETMVSNGAKLSVLWYGGYLVIQSEILTSGQLASFILYTHSLASAASSITSSLQKIATATGSCERLFELMDYKNKIKFEGGKKLENFKGKIEFKNVGFSYPNIQDVKTLDGFNLEIQPGEQIAFVGSSGSGKSTIIRLIERFYDVSEGQLLIDGEDIKNLQIADIRNHIGYVSQEPILFSGTIEENLAYGVGQEYTEYELEMAIRQACANEFIHDETLFPKGYRTHVGEQGVKLSGGQKQRIAIARALLKKPQILIFDEATSALDAESEFQVQDAIDNLMKECSMTIIIIAHRLSTIVNCDKIVVLNQGKIEGVGNHNELAETNEIYKNLIDRQMNVVVNS